MDDLVTWLCAQIDEDERRAPELHRFGCDALVPDLTCDCDYPARVLREVEAKRKIFDGHQPVEHYGDKPRVCATCGDPPGYDYEWQAWPCPTVLALAKVYGYDEEPPASHEG